MPEGDATHSAEPSDPPRRRTGRLLRASSTGLVLLVLAAAVTAYQFQLGPRWFGWEHPSPVTAPAQVAPPPGLTLPEAPPAVAVAGPPAEPTVAAAKVRRALASLVGSRPLGRHVAVQVTQLADGVPVYRHGADRVTPASTLKLLTAAAVLSVLGPDHAFATTVVQEPGSRRIVLVGGGDPLLGREPAAAVVYPARADLETLARATAQRLRALGRTRVRLGYDASLFTGPPVNPRWEASYIPDDVVSPISALWVDEGRERAGSADRSVDPAAAAAVSFAAALARHHVTVSGPARPATASGVAEELASVHSAPLGQIVQHVVEVSDNEGAEVLARHVAVALGEPASFSGAARAVRAALDELGISTAGLRIVDGSGLSRANRIDPATLLAVLGASASPEHPELRPVVADLPVAGFTGSLARRFEVDASAGLGVVRAKTGTLTGVHGLAGVVTSADGAVLGFVAIADKVKVPRTLAARDTLDQIAAALAGCRCATR